MSSAPPQSGLASIRRDFSSNAVKSEPASTSTVAAAGAQQKKSKLSAAMRAAISQGVASRAAAPSLPTPPPTAPAPVSGVKRAAGGGGGGAPPPAKRPFRDENASPRRPAPKQEVDMDMSTPRVVEAQSTHKTNTKLASLFLSQEQRAILELVQRGESVFYTGSAGTGKSVLLREIIKVMQKRYPASDAVAITASTGIAACNIGGITLHSFAGIGLGTESAEDLVKKIRKNRKTSSRWLRTKVLIIDELSMVDGELFDKVATIACLMRNTAKPFGGIQLIVTGDFFQLPPVTKGGKMTKFAFEAVLWPECIKRNILLTKVFRQKDQTFVNMLNEMRYGQLTPDSIKAFRALARPIHYQDGIGPTELFPRREDVDAANMSRMSKLSGEARTFAARDGGMAGEQERARLLANFMAPETLHLQVGAQVMLIKNVDETLVNGSMGIVQRFVDPSKYASELGGEPPAPAGGKDAGKKKGEAPRAEKLVPLVEFSTPGGGKRPILVLPEEWKVELPSGEVQARRQQLPLILSWAMSIHKSQGQTLERVRVDLGRVFERGQAYVALSRATSLEGLQVLNFNPSKVLVHDKVVEWYRTLERICVEEAAE